MLKSVLQVFAFWALEDKLPAVRIVLALVECRSWAHHANIGMKDGFQLLCQLLGGSHSASLGFIDCGKFEEIGERWEVAFARSASVSW